MLIITNKMIVDSMLLAIQDKRLLASNHTDFTPRYYEPGSKCCCAIGAALPHTAAMAIADDPLMNAKPILDVPWASFGLGFEDMTFASEMQMVHDTTDTPDHWRTRDLAKIAEQAIGQPAMDVRRVLGRHHKTPEWWIEFLDLVKQHIETPA